MRRKSRQEGLDATQGLRSVDGRLETAVNQFKDLRGRSVFVVGIEHVGEARYYEEVRAWVDAHSVGAVVRHEQLEQSDESDARNEEERKALVALQASLGSRFDPLQAVGLNLIQQTASAMAWGPVWESSGVPEIDVVRALGPAGIMNAPQRRKAEALAVTIERSPEGGLILSLLRRNMARGLLRRPVANLVAKKDRNPWDYRVVYAWRETVELIKVLGMEEDVVMIWGAPHMAGFAEGLTRNGYALVETKWFVVLDKDRLVKRKGTPDKADSLSG